MMKRNILFFLLSAAALPMSAQVANGYYRVQNQKSERYIQVLDNHGKVNMVTTEFDLAAIHTQKPFSEIVDDASTIIYIEYAGTKQGNDFQYNLKAQGTSTYDITGGMKVSLKVTGPAYQAYGTKSGLTAYLMDENWMEDDGYLDHTDNPSNKRGYCNWYLLPVSQADDHYFGLKPSISAEGRYYTSFYASFPFNTYSTGMQVFKVTKVDGSYAVYEEITGTVPASTPVFFSSTTNQANTNRLDIVNQTVAPLTGNNLLRGVYFCNTDAGLHFNVVKYDANTMRVLGVTKSGKIGFVKSKDAYIARNSAYLVVPAGSPDELTLMTAAEYEEARSKVTITAKSYSRKYGEENPQFEYTVSDGTINSGAPVLTCSATKTSPVGTYDIVVSKGTVSNSNATLVNGKLTVTKAALTVTANSFTIKQNEALPTFTAKYSGWKNGESETVLSQKPSFTCNVPADKKPGTYQIVVSGAAATNYDISYVAGTLTIVEADPITITAENKTRQYGEENPQLTFKSSAAITGEPKLSTTATKASAVGSYPIVVEQGTVNYPNLKFQNGTLTVTKAPLTVTANSFTIKQNEALPTFTAVYSGWKNGESETVLSQKPTFTCNVPADKKPGTYEIVVSGAAATNYDISYVAGTLTIVEADPITITAEDKTRQYGEENPQLTFKSSAAITGEPKLSTTATKASAVGSYPIVVEQGTVNYPNLKFQNGTLTVTTAPLTVTANSFTIKQNEALPTFTAVYSGWKNGESEAVLSQKPTFTCNVPADKKPGTYEIAVSGAAATNYDISYVAGTLTIVEADPITITAKNVTMVYGDAVPQLTYEVAGGTLSTQPKLVCAATSASNVGDYAISVDVSGIDYPNLKTVDGVLTITKAPLTASAGIYTMKQTEERPEFKATYSGFRNGDTEAVFTVQPVFATTAPADNAPGTYEVTLSGGEALNYSFNYVAGQLIISDADPITITVNDETMVYGDAVPAFTYTVEGGSVQGEPVITCDATETSGVGEYVIKIEKGTIDYPCLVLVNGRLTVTKAPLTASAGSYTMKQTDERPEFKATYSGFRNGDTEEVFTAQPVFATNAPVDNTPGTYEVTISGIAAANYDVTYVAGQLVITEADPITITVNSETMVYGDAVPTFTYTVEGGIVSGEPVISCEATSVSPVGEYAITIEKGSVDYPNLVLVNGTLTVTQAELTVKVVDSERFFGDPNPTFELVYEGFRNGDTEEVLIAKPVATTDATEESPVGEYVVKVSGGEAENYYFVYVDGVLKVNEASGITAIVFNRPVDVYTLSGRKVRSQVTTLDGLAKGVYVINGRKTVLR